MENNKGTVNEMEKNIMKNSLKRISIHEKLILIDKTLCPLKESCANETELMKQSSMMTMVKIQVRMKIMTIKMYDTSEFLAPEISDSLYHFAAF